MDWDLYEAVHGAVRVANALQHTLSSLITNEWLTEKQEEPEVPPVAAPNGA